MLNTLAIRNFALIGALDIDFRQGFSVITGETGAGKSIILGALGLVLGSRADAKQVKEGAQKCVVEATFTLTAEQKSLFSELCPDCDWDSDECILRRELGSNGKSRAFINDTPATLSAMKTVGDRLIDIHSQHQNLLLSDDCFQLRVLDTMAGNGSLTSQYAAAYDAYRQKEAAIKAMQKKIADNKANEDYLRFQLDELTTAGLQPGMQEELEESSRLLSHAEEISEAVAVASTALSADGTGAVAMTISATNALDRVGSVYPLAAELAERLRSARIEMADIADELARSSQSIEFNPAELERVNALLDTIYSLQRKHHLDTVEQLISKREEIAALLSAIDDSDYELGKLRSEASQAEKEARSLAEKITSSRREAAKKIESGMTKGLKSLGMPDIRFSIEVSPAQSLTPKGADEAQFLFSANKGMPLRRVSEIASGGEIARVMLTLKSIMASVMSLPTIVFDEIDTGVSGKVAEQMAAMMRDMAGRDNQVISISHLPQIAAMAKWHYKVEKSNRSGMAESSMRLLSADERVEALAQMLSGSVVTEAATNNARQLIEAAQTE